MVLTNIRRKKRIKNMLIISIILFTYLLSHIAWIQFIQGSELQAMAYIQQTLDRSINPKRGTIFDSKGRELAISASVETVSVNPTNISEKDKEKVAKCLSDIFSLDYEKVLKKVTKRSSIETIVKKVEKEQTDKLRIWMLENNIETGINIDEDTKRYYPYSTLASNIIGFTGSDNQGLDGIEAYYDKSLKGTQGQILKLTDARGTNIENETGEAYVKAINGNDIVLTLDVGIQAIVEKYLKQACIDNVCTDGGNIIVTNPKTGEILAMATYPNYDLNNPYEINLEELKEIWETLESKDKSEALQQMWRNKAISDTYEPGSTFKIVTASAALEEGIVTSTDNEGEFCCIGHIEIAGARIKCWRYYRPHGVQSLRQALMNSCNPVFIGLGQKIGIEKYYDYLEKFGLLSKTGIDLPGEAGSIFLKEEKVGPVELATISFGQRFEITPLHMATIISTVANKGLFIKPTVVKKIINSQTGESEEIRNNENRRVISEKTAEQVLSMMESVVAEGTGKNAQVKGYAIGGKTGTSEDGVNTNKYVTSFVGVTPIDSPELVIVIVLYNPTGQGGHQGGAVAAPIASQILGEILPYLEIQNELEENIQNVIMPNVINNTLKETTKILNECGLNTEIEGLVEEKTDYSEYIVVEQLPKQGISIQEGTKVFLKVE